jgi:diadenosine tetraphosphate (Ap4A) HIT family hydrolase
MALIYETDDFTVEAVDKPLITRLDGGHLTITPKVRVADRTKLSPRLAIEFMRLTMIVGEAMETALNARGIDIGRINYQDNGNWAVFRPQGPHFHLHLYGRAKSATIQKYGESCLFPFMNTGFYDGNEPLNEGDLLAIRNQIELIASAARFDKGDWKL